MIHTSQICANSKALAIASRHNGRSSPVMLFCDRLRIAQGFLEQVARTFPVLAVEGFDGHRLHGAAVDAAGVDADAVGM